MRDQPSSLDGFTQAHVVCEDSAQSEVAEEGQPGQAAFLVGTQLAAE